MRKLKALLINEASYTNLINALADRGITTDLALLKADHLALSRQTGIPSQLLRALKRKVARLSAVSESVTTTGELTRYSTGFEALDRYLCGGFCHGHVIEITGLTKATNTKMSLYTIESFLHSHPSAIVHYISTTGMIGLREIETTIRQAQKRHERQNINLMERIQCYTVFTALEASNLLVQIGARHLTSSAPAMVVVSDVVHLLESEWNSTSEQRSSLANGIKSLRNLGLSFLIIHSTTGHQEANRPWMVKAQGLIEQWDSGIDIRLLILPRRPLGLTCNVLKARTKVTQAKSTMQLDW